MNKNQIFIISVFLSLLVVSFVIGLNRTRFKIYKEVHQNTCELVYEKYVVHDDFLKDWLKECLAASTSIDSSWNKEQYLLFLRDQLYRLPFSHLDVYSPPDEKAMWQGVDKDTGIEVHAINGRYVVSFLEPLGPAIKAGVEVGDELLAINSEPILSKFQISKANGILSLRRNGKVIEVEISPVEFKKQQEPSVAEVSPGVLLLKVPSFRPELFDQKFWTETAKELMAAKKVIVDLRGNRGGNFVAMLRVASSLLCEAKVIGSVDQDRRQWVNVGEFNDNLDEQDHLLSLKDYDRILLKTFTDYPCIRAEVNILVDNNTASVSEMFARSLQSIGRAKVLGGMTAGEAVLAVWYKLDLLGPGYSLSIPEAIYRDNQGESFEGMGVTPNKELFYDLELALKGQDSWVIDSRTF